jgi:dihydroorotate dehydrogenase electron transfer subunit
MKSEKSIITNRKIYNQNTFSITFSSDYLASSAKPGQFLNIKVNEESSFILRRPISIAEIDGNSIEIIISVVGKGTKALYQKKTGEELDFLGPLGNGFNLNSNFDTAIIIGGGIGVAPFPFLNSQLLKSGKKVINFLGFRKKSEIIELNLQNTKYSTDDGGLGFKGNVVELFNECYSEFKNDAIKVFACGPGKMLSSVVHFCKKNMIDAEVSLESNMACGFGICLGCPVESAGDTEKHKFICKDGPCFNINEIKI